MDGKGGLYEGSIINPNPQQCSVQIVSRQVITDSKKHRLHIAISPTKNPDRIEWMLEKCTELGVDTFSFLLCKRTEKSGLKRDRLQKILESASKQSLRSFLPVLNEVVGFQDFVKQIGSGSAYIAHCIKGNKKELQDTFTNTEIYILIGPEGDFTEEEINYALLNGVQPRSLGASRLRTETAALYVAAAFKNHFLL